MTVFASPYQYRIGLDLGGTKIEAAALLPDGSLRMRRRIPTPAGYEARLTAMADLIGGIEAELGGRGSIGLGIPGAISPASGVVKNANSVVLNGRPLDRDLAALLGREVRVANDANCFALSEAADGAGAGRSCVFGVIVGTGCGGGIVHDGRLLEGRHRIAGEWGHMSLPWPDAGELPGTTCWCGRRNCLETYISGTGLAMDCDGPQARDASSIPGRAAAGEARAQAALARHADRMARGLAMVIDLLDPDVIVLGGGLSNMAHLYVDIPRLLPNYVFSDVVHTPVVQNLHGDSSGVRGAAWLWPAPPP
ncbi:manno(fructo)kinase [Rhodovastum atsumiense]|uniref:ROK family protein n=1 Tax=Rhodovastum atsumiense TaxID=504468 RepID=A0A5M6IVR6_9PROT|nr:ROK family protein [Rhodovastum atsumiense]KAA5612372.1 ROK family protein [Rhodovastum atsumiense]CAH2600271.1 manno(fructo)kinase [Rhodovastum atsumiense]